MKVSTVKVSKDKGFVSEFSNTKGSHVHALINENGEFGFLDGEKDPYTPIGGRSALIDVFNMNCIEFRSYEWGGEYKISKPTAI